MQHYMYKLQHYMYKFVHISESQIVQHNHKCHHANKTVMPDHFLHPCYTVINNYYTAELYIGLIIRSQTPYN